MTYFRCDRSLEEVAAAWNRAGPHQWEMRESDQRDYILARIDGNKVRVYADPPEYEIDVTPPPEASPEQRLAERTALDEMFRKHLFPLVSAKENSRGGSRA